MYPNLHPPRVILSLFQHIWFLWCAISFIATSIVAFIAYLIIFNFFDHDKAYKYSFVVTKYWGKTLLALILVRVRTEGAHKLNPNEAYVIISNHQSMMDIPLGMAICPVPFSFLAKVEVDKIPVVGYLARRMHVYVDRKSQESRQESYLRMCRHLQNNKSIHIFVEGTRNRTDEALLKFYDGAFRLAIETQKPLAILTLCDAYKILNPNEAFKASPANLTCIWDDPIPTTGLTLNDVEMLKEMAYQRILANLNAQIARRIA